MLKLLERNVASIERRLILLAPPQVAIPETFTNVTIDSRRRAELVRGMQAVRGTIYLNEGNVSLEQLSPEGLHETPEDAKSWHLLLTDSSGQISSCAWYMEHGDAASLKDLRIRTCPLAKTAEWGDKLQASVEQEIAQARRNSLRYAEVGGWAVSKARRCSSEGLVLALAAYGLCRMLGGALGITTANVTHASSSILRRLGGSYLEFNGIPLPSYFDPKYKTQIELLRFDSRRPSAKYVDLIDKLKLRLAHVPVVGASRDAFIAQHQFFSPAERPIYAV